MRFRSLLAALLTGVLVLVGATSATAAITRSDFPSTRFVKTTMKGKGAWDRTFWRAGAFPTEGATVRPSRCGWDPMSGSSQARRAEYSGALKGSPYVTGSADVVVYRFATTARAKKALTRVRKYVQQCGRTTVVLDPSYDESYLSLITLRGARKVGQGSVAWNEKVGSLGWTTSRVIAARSGSTIVVTSVGHYAGAGETAYKYPTWKQADALARKALKAAT